jgi:hypothetical protein
MRATGWVSSRHLPGQFAPPRAGQATRHEQRLLYFRCKYSKTRLECTPHQGLAGAAKPDMGTPKIQLPGRTRGRWRGEGSLTNTYCIEI